MQLWVGNNMNKISNTGSVLFKMLSTKIVQCTKATVRLARTSLHTITLKDYNYNVETLVNEMESKIKLLSCGGEEPHSVFADIFRIFSKAKNEEFRSLVQQYSRLYDEGTPYEYDWLLNTFVTKYKQLINEGEWKDGKDETNMVAMLQQIQYENTLLKTYVMNMAKGTNLNQAHGSGRSSTGYDPDKDWKLKM